MAECCQVKVVLQQPQRFSVVVGKSPLNVTIATTGTQGATGATGATGPSFEPSLEALIWINW